MYHHGRIFGKITFTQTLEFSGSASPYQLSRNPQDIEVNTCLKENVVILLSWLETEQLICCLECCHRHDDH